MTRAPGARHERACQFLRGQKMVEVYKEMRQAGFTPAQSLACARDLEAFLKTLSLVDLFTRVPRSVLQ